MNKFLLPILVFFASILNLNAQCEPELLNCNALVQACDVSNNNESYWNAQVWWDAQNQLHDLAESSIDLNLAVRDNCPGSVLSVRCLLFLDLDGNGTQETVVDSDNLPAAASVNFNNADNPNYSGGTARLFDQRLVPATQRWRFALRTTTVGDSSNFSLRWASQDNPGVFVLPELAYGNHKVRWIVTNNLGFEQTCEKTFEVKDCKAPFVVCLNEISVNIMPTQMVTLWATDFLVYAEDNTTPYFLLDLGIRKAGSGTGFPVDPAGNPVTSVTFGCSELGFQSLELWAKDKAGNADFCLTNLIVQDNLGNCLNPPSDLQVCAKDACSAVGLEDVTFNFEINQPNLPPIVLFESAACAAINQVLPDNTDITITPVLDDNPLNGVSTYDLVLMQNFIDGVGAFSSPYKWIAADANKDNVVDSLDVLECKKLILGIYTELPNNNSWRFVDKNYVFPSPNPLSAPFPESIIVNTGNLPATDPEFLGIKICDVNCTSVVGFFDLPLENEHLIGTPQPNPTTEGSMLPLQLLSDETVLVEVLDFAGRLVFHQNLQLPAGPALFEIPASAMPQAGMYLWRIQAGKQAKSGKIVRN